MQSNVYILGIDPSGSFVEGKGTTGFTLLKNGKLIEQDIISASDFKSQMEYWAAHLTYIMNQSLKHRDGAFAISMEDYVLYASAAKAQINSEMETSKLIGAIMMHAYQHNIPVYMRNASIVMKRWTNHILEHKGYIHRCGKGFRTDIGPINHHSLDSLRHAIHCHHFEYGKKAGRY